jgi:hypothetical protein
LVMHPTGVFNIVYREYLTRCFYNDSKWFMVNLKN